MWVQSFHFMQFIFVLFQLSHILFGDADRRSFHCDHFYSFFSTDFKFIHQKGCNQKGAFAVAVLAVHNHTHFILPGIVDELDC